MIDRLNCFVQTGLKFPEFYHSYHVMFHVVLGLDPVKSYLLMHKSMFTLKKTRVLSTCILGVQDIFSVLTPKLKISYNYNDVHDTSA